MSAPLQVLVNGEAGDARWTLDRAFQYGDGLFETMVVRGGSIRFEELHRDRLATGCRRLAIDVDPRHIWQTARSLAAVHGAALLKLQVTRGDAIARGYGTTGAEKSRFVIWVYPPAPAQVPDRIRVVTLNEQLGENPRLAGLKHCNRLEQVLARQALAATGAFEGLMAAGSGPLISGTMSNVFLELEDALVTPALDRCGIAGVMRAVVLREAAHLDLPLRVAEVPPQVLARCTGVALSNVRLGLLAVDELDGRPMPQSARLRQLADRVATLEA